MSGNSHSAARWIHSRGLVSPIRRINGGVLAYIDQGRLGISRARVVPPAFILLDEPAAGMSEAECENLMLLVKAIPSKGAMTALLHVENLHIR
jgi:branched-chain amino acid transport system ATP-binding protein